MSRIRAFSSTGMLVILAVALPAHAVEWKVALSYGSANVVLPQLPPTANDHAVSNVRLADSGVAALGFSLSQDNGPSGLWSERAGGVLQPFAQNGMSGVTGPGRTGVESNHVFRNLHAPMDSIGAGYRVFGGEANDPAAPANDASGGLWQFDGARNIEIARLGSDGVLGPGIGAGWTFSGFNHINNVSGFANTYSLSGRRAVVNGRVKFQNALSESALVQYIPGVGNVPCMVQGSTHPAWSPGIAGIGPFGGMDIDVAISPRGELYGGAGTTATLNQRGGLWKFCDGAPQAQALTGETGTLGPGLSTSTAYFTDLYARTSPSTPGSLYFTGSGRMSSVSGAPTFLGLFLRANGSNRPILLRHAEGALGPNIAGHVFNTNLAPFEVKAAGRYAVLMTPIGPVGSTATTYGVWRITPETGAIPLALIGDTGAYAPAAGRTWSDFHAKAVFDNGDVVVLASVTSPGEISLWRLRPGVAPERLLGPGTPITISFATGTATRTVTSIFTAAINNMSIGAGTDAWAGADGTLIMPVYLQGLLYTSTIRARVTSPDLIFADGFQ